MLIVMTLFMLAAIRATCRPISWIPLNHRIVMMLGGVMEIHVNRWRCQKHIDGNSGWPWTRYPRALILVVVLMAVSIVIDAIARVVYVIIL